MVWCYGREDTSRSGEATFARKIATTVSTDTPPFAATRHDKRFRFVYFTTASFMPSPTTPHNPTDRPFTYTHTTTTTTMNDCGLVVSRRGVGHSPHTHTFWRVCSDWCEQQQRGAPSARGSNGSVSVARLRDFDPFITRNTPWARAIRCMMPHTIADDDDDGDGEDAVRKKKEPTHHRNRSTAFPPVVPLLPSDALSLSLLHIKVACSLSCGHPSYTLARTLPFNTPLQNNNSSKSNNNTAAADNDDEL